MCKNTVVFQVPNCYTKAIIALSYFTYKFACHFEDVKLLMLLSEYLVCILNLFRKGWFGIEIEIQVSRHILTAIIYVELRDESYIGSEWTTF